jgi:hypothetical protein
MTLWARALIGAALGAIGVLLFHPESRGYYLALLPPGPSRSIATTPWLPENKPALQAPRTLHEVAYWVLLAAEREVDGAPVSNEDAEKLLFLVRYAAKEDVPNAFWKQMEAVYAWKLSERENAFDAWLAASQRTLFNDWQTPRLEHISRSLDEEQGSRMSWHQAYAYHRRSSAIARQIAAFAHEMHRDESFEESDQLLIRYSSAMNAKLMREGGRSNAIADIAVQMGDDAATAGTVQARLSPRVLHLARLELMHRLQAADHASLGSQVIAAYNDNDAWVALGRRGDTDAKARTLTQISLLLGVVPSGFLAVALLGVCFAWAGAALSTSRDPAFITHQPKYVSASSPGPRPRRFVWPWGPANPVTPIFSSGARFSLALFTMVWALVALGAVVSTSSAAFELRPFIRAPLGYSYAGFMFLCMAIALLALLLVIGFLSAPRKKLSPSHAAGHLLQHFGKVLFGYSLILAILVGPLAIYVDQLLGDTISKLLQNEPTYYLIQP